MFKSELKKNDAEGRSLLHRFSFLKESSCPVIFIAGCEMPWKRHTGRCRYKSFTVSEKKCPSRA
jgi:hypothetical protein